ncbi:hypothetical protein WA026_009566 [Henosepilachna vigintioctopunctata]|uniref:Probable RNA-binding protein EIF1AD n=1 Tax=Henosepilachna vigintioctopunctata TaxID=420089 RepID=A0AAW1U443_9CUCU
MKDDEDNNTGETENLINNEDVSASESNFEMSRATKRKHVMREVLEDDFSPPKENQQIVRIVASRGNNLHQVEAPDSSTFLVSMPTKFRRNIWVKRGDFVIIEPIVEGDKVKGEIVKILSAEHIKWFKKDNIWPQAFTKEEKKETEEFEENPNRPPVCYYESDDSSDSSNSSGSEL